MVETDNKPLQSSTNSYTEHTTIAKNLAIFAKVLTRSYVQTSTFQNVKAETKENLNTENVSVNLLSYLSVSPEKFKVFQAETQKEAVLV